MFNFQRLILARKRRKVTARILADAIGVTPITISRWENCVREPELDNIKAAANFLGFPISFFYGDDVEELPVAAVSFRSLSSMTAKQRDAALSAGVIAYMFYDWVASRFNLPEVCVPDIGEGVTPEEAARIVRSTWNLGDVPISNMTKLLESKGVRVFSLSEDTNSVDAFSCWRDDQPFAFLNTHKSAERSRFDAAHELGHLVLHRHGSVSESRGAECEADRFASEFLMPRDDVTAHLSYVVDIDQLVRAKKRWGVSVAALSYRLNKLGFLTEWQNRSFNIEISKRGYRRCEPNGLPRETSGLWPKIFSALWQERLTRDNVAQELNLPTCELDALLLHLGENSVPTARTALHIV